VQNLADDDLSNPEDWPVFTRRCSKFIIENTALARPPLVPELQLWLASDITPLWKAVEKALDSRNIPAPFWSFAWAGGQALSRYILDHPETVRGKKVFDFATGSGLCALAAKLAGAKEVTANDIDPFAIVATGMNAEANNLQVLVAHEDNVGRALPQPDIILAGDFCYEWPMAGYAVEWMRSLVKQGKTVIFADPGRVYTPHEGTELLATYEVPTPRAIEDSDMKVTRVCRMLEEEE
jgi:predicted nicotinamide N-methyase